MGIDDPTGLMFTAKMLGTCLAVFFGICFFIGLFAGEQMGIEPLKIPDKIDLGYIRDNQTIKTVSVKTVDTEKLEIQKMRNKLEKMRLEDQMRTLQKKKADSKKKKTCEQNPLMKDCVQALVAMGEKQKDAINKVNSYFKNYPDTKTVNDFILGVFKR